MTTEPIWLNVEQVLWAHYDQLQRYGGLSGIRDDGLLKSAIFSPKHLYYYQKASVARLACKYGFGIIMNHPFSDGNKRTGVAIINIFLSLNSFYIDIPHDLLFDFAYSLASRKITEEEWENCLGKYIYKSP